MQLRIGLCIAKILVYNTYMTLAEKIKDLPKEPGVYLMKDINGTIIYIGKAKSLKNRVSQYFGQRSNQDEKVKAMVSNIADFLYIVTPTELDALALEKNLVLKHQPHYNILLKDGKAYQYIRIDTRKDFPALEVTRKLKKDGARYFGPFFNGVRAKDIIKALTYAYPVRCCATKITNKPKRPCLNHHINLCSAPCAGKVSVSAYHECVEQVVSFLNGNSKDVEALLLKKMNIASGAEQFEAAIILRDMLVQLQKLTDRTIAYLPREVDVDAIGYASNGIMAAISVYVVRGGRGIGCESFHVIDASLSLEEALSNFMLQYYTYNSRIPKEIMLPVSIADDSAIIGWLNNERGSKVNVSAPERGDGRKLLAVATRNAEVFLEKFIEKERAHRDFTLGAVEQLQKEVGLRRTPYRIEAYDISNISGTDKVASMVVFLGGEPAKSHYRKFIIKTVEGSDDFKSMNEVLSRRFAELGSNDMSFSSRPDLILIDGGKGQLSSALKAMHDSGEDIEMISLAKKEEEIFVPGSSVSIKLPKHNYALRLCQRVRDEAHRFAITFHRSLRGKGAISKLEQIEGIGEVKRKALLKHFRSIDAIKQASLEQLMLVSKISKTDAEKIYSFFR